MMEIRQAVEADIAAIVGIDRGAQVHEQRRTFIYESVGAGRTWLAMVNGRVVGYTVLEYHFFSQGFIAMLYVDASHRRKGIAAALVRHVESICTTEKLFTSTNESNRPMQALMAKLDYAPSGVLNNLDEGDPEVFYFKRVRKDQTTCK